MAETKPLTVGSLFSGIGELDLGLERAGMRVIWQSEIDEYACRVLNKHWPEVPNHGNIKEIDWATVERPDIICGGYPCQPFSLTGRRKGTDDPRHLWPWVKDAISHLRPRYALLENVRGHLSLGGVEVIGELASIGYDAEWHIVPASSVGAPHRRDRLIIVAYPNDSGSRTPGCVMERTGQETLQGWKINAQHGSSRRSPDVAYADSEQLGQRGLSQDAGQAHSCRDDYPGREETDGEWEWWAVEPSVGRVADGVPNRVDRLRALGNAVVPQVAEFIGQMIVRHYERTLGK